LIDHKQDNTMTTQKRTCANCAAFNPTPAGDDPTCWNMVSIIEQHGTPHALRRSPGLNDDCPDHLTNEESTDQDAFIDAHRDIGGLEGALRASYAIEITNAIIRRAQR
jgi:hypothetical protein